MTTTQYEMFPKGKFISEIFFWAVEDKFHENFSAYLILSWKFKKIIFSTFRQFVSRKKYYNRKIKKLVPIKQKDTNKPLKNRWLAFVSRFETAH